MRRSSLGPSSSHCFNGGHSFCTSQRPQFRRNITTGSLLLTMFPFRTVEASDVSSCCFLSQYQAVRASSMLVCFDWHAMVSRQLSAAASRNPEAMPCPPTTQPSCQYGRFGKRKNDKFCIELTWRKYMGRVAAQNDSSQSPPVTASCREAKRPTAKNLYTVGRIPNVL